MKTEYTLHPALRAFATEISGKKKVLISGGGDDILIDDDQEILSSYLSGNSIDTLDNQSEIELSKLFEILLQRGTVRKTGEDAAQNKDWLIFLFDFLKTNLYEYKARMNRAMMQKNVLVEAPRVVRILQSDRIAKKISSLLTGMGYEVTHGWEKKDSNLATPELLLMTAEYFDSSLLNKANLHASQIKSPILFTMLDEHRVRIGPFYVPGASGCFRCFEKRTIASAKFPEVLETPRVSSTLSPSWEPSETLITLAASLASIELAKYLSELPHLLDLGRVIEYDAIAGAMEAGVVLRSPRCEACGNHVPAQTPRATSWTM